MIQNTISDVFRTLRDGAKGIKVLYVEDDPIIRKEYLTFLSRFFDTVGCKEDGEAGLAAALSNSYDIIISDVQMPRMSGLQMIQNIKRERPNQITILISAHKDSDILHKSVTLGVDGYLFKPIDRYQTVELLSKIVEKIKLEYENKNYKIHLQELVALKSEELIKTFTTDPITGLYSLAKLEKDLLDSGNISLAILKIKNFKNLNDIYGYSVGNELLKQTGEFLSKKVYDDRELYNINLYRISGAHFALFCDLETSRLVQVVKEIIEQFEATEFILETDLMYLEMDAGIIDQENGLYLSNADKALRESEKKREIVVYQRNIQEIAQRNFDLKCKDSLKRALDEERIIPYYQPIIDNDSYSIKKYEALARLIMPDGTVISPGMFLPVSKETKMYNRITLQLITAVLKDFRESDCSVSINLSIDDIKHIPTKIFIFDAVSNFPDPSRLVFELLESEEIDSYHEISQFIDQIKEFGCKVAIDDFGSGYSNFEYLAKLNVDYIKIDGSLVKEIDTDKVSKIIVEMLSGFAKKMGIKTIAEFVSKESLHTIVKNMGVDESQGYLFSAPIPYNLSMQKIQKHTGYIEN